MGTVTWPTVPTRAWFISAGIRLILLQLPSPTTIDLCNQTCTGFSRDPSQWQGISVVRDDPSVGAVDADEPAVRDHPLRVGVPLVDVENQHGVGCMAGEAPDIARAPGRAVPV